MRRRPLYIKTIIFILFLVGFNVIAWKFYVQRVKQLQTKKESLVEGQNEEPNSFLHIITNFPVTFPGNDSQTPKGKERVEEFVVCLEKNLAHPLVKRIHLLLENQMEKDVIVQRNLPKQWKLVYNIIGSPMSFAHVFNYSSKYLLHETALQLNADCYLEDGWEKLNVTILRQKTLYALTRHESEHGKKHCGYEPRCGGSQYIGSHDAFVFHLTEPMPEMVIKKVDHPLPQYGIEKVLISTIRLYGKFTVKNPCKILHLIHYHCSNYRIYSRKTIKGKSLDNIVSLDPRVSAAALFTNEL